MGIHIIVCIKSVVTDAPNGKIIRTPDTVAINPFDLTALEMGLTIKEELGGTVTALSMGPDVSSLSLYTAISMGADKGVLLCDKALAGSDTLATSTALSAGIKKLAPYDLVLFGTRSADSDTGQVGPQTAVALDIPIVTQAHETKFKDKGINVNSECDGFLQRFSMSMPCALTVSQDAAKPRDAGLLGIQEAYEDKIKIWNLKDIGLSASQVGDLGSPTKVMDMAPVVRGKKCDFISGSPEEQASVLLEKLLDEGLIR